MGANVHPRASFFFSPPPPLGSTTISVLTMRLHICGIYVSSYYRPLGLCFTKSKGAHAIFNARSGLVRAVHSKARQTVASAQALMRKNGEKNLSPCLDRKANPHYRSAVRPFEVVHRCARERRGVMGGRAAGKRRFQSTRVVGKRERKEEREKENRGRV